MYKLILKNRLETDTIILFGTIHEAVNYGESQNTTYEIRDEQGILVCEGTLSGEIPKSFLRE